MDENNRNFLLAILLSIGVLFAWQFFFVPKPHPPAEKPPVEQSQQQQQTEQGPPRPGAQSETPSAGGPTAPAAGAAATLTREEALAQSPRIAIDTPALKGSIALKGGRIDDLTLEDYRETVDPDSPTSSCSRRKAGRMPTTPSMASSAETMQTLRFHPPTRCGRRRAKGRSPGARRLPSPMTTAKASPSPAPSRSTISTCSRSPTRWRIAALNPSRSILTRSCRATRRRR